MCGAFFYLKSQVVYEHLYSLKIASLLDQELRSHHIIAAKNIHHIKRLNGPLVNGIIKKSHLKIACGRRVCTTRLVDHRVLCFWWIIVARRKRCLQSLTYHLVKFIFHLCKRRARACVAVKRTPIMSSLVVSSSFWSVLLLFLISQVTIAVSLDIQINLNLHWKSRRKNPFLHKFFSSLRTTGADDTLFFSAIRSDHSAMSTFSCQTIADPQRSSKFSCVSRVRNIRISQIQWGDFW